MVSRASLSLFTCILMWWNRQNQIITTTLFKKKDKTRVQKSSCLAIIKKFEMSTGWPHGSCIDLLQQNCNYIYIYGHFNPQLSYLTYKYLLLKFSARARSVRVCTLDWGNSTWVNLLSSTGCPAPFLCFLLVSLCLCGCSCFVTSL